MLYPFSLLFGKYCFVPNGTLYLVEEKATLILYAPLGNQ